MHVLSLPPAFVLSQDQTLKLKNLIFWTTWIGISKEFLRLTGTFHINTSQQQVAPSSNCIGDGIYETQFRQSLIKPHIITDVGSKPGLRRLRFPSFKFNFQRATTDSNASQSVKTDFRDNVDTPGKNRLEP